MKKIKLLNLAFLLLVVITSSCGRKNEHIEVEIPKRETFVVEKKSVLGQEKVKTKQGPFEMHALSFQYEEIENLFKPEDLALHYGVIHLDYANRLNTALHGTPYVTDSLVGILTKVPPSQAELTNAAGAYYNHDFFWQSINKNTTTSPNTGLSALISSSFGSYNNLKAEITRIAVEFEGSGWLWLLVDHRNNLTLITTENNANPITLRLGKPLLVIDLWEHAYLPSYKNDKEKYIKALLPHLNWEFANRRLSDQL
ncbi:superoxide dismutase [Myroides sp. 1354]|uniref:superoxide dismutase n=1 Tax=unclassified Myroides TaxID=2642485 RepID=UPI002574984A|nr:MULTISPECIES: superoxide dismutase [unclassified Myroides]MDM1045416.1 superoxide dismutase [Myroides sp. R163-1]MDM1056347.1 superoxide dismutase [Myroides sp. 1354]MDM1069547.1 superoxide dismutase [Myroides sp. 1372]